MKRLEWARKYTEEAANDGFSDVVWTESSIQMEAHRRPGARPKPR